MEAPASSQTSLPAKNAEARVEEAAKELANVPRFRDMELDKRKALMEFLVGNSLFVVAHELGHAVISEMSLPVLGREEDAADAFAAVIAIQMKAGFTDRVLTEAAKGWFLADMRDKKEGGMLEYYDEHGLNLQRAYNIVCLMVGSDFEKYKRLADETKLPEDRQKTCAGDYSNASWSWEQALKPHRRAPDQPKVKVEVVYKDTTGKFERMAKSIQSMRMLETIAEHAADRFAWTAPFKFQVQSCDEPNANWNLKERTLFVCYELIEDFAELYMKYGDKLKPARQVKSRR
jgi:hypothetical protein